MARLISTKHVSLNSIPGSIQRVVVDHEVSLHISVISWDQGSSSHKELTLDQFAAWTPESQLCHWVNVSGFQKPELLGILESKFSIHPLTLEDMVNLSHTPKIEDYPEYRYLVAKMLRLSGEQILSEQLSLIQQDNMILSFQEVPGDVFDPIRQRLATGAGRIRSRGGDYALFAILDSLVDGYIEVVEFFGSGIEVFEDSLFERQDGAAIAEIRRAKALMTDLRRFSLPLSEALDRMLRWNGERFDPADRPFYNDLKDHLHAVIGAVNGYQEMLRDQLNLYTALQNYRMTDVMKVLTVISTIFIPLTFVAGIYGMNFHAMPELSHPYGYPIVLGVMGITTTTMLVLFKRRGWLGRRHKKKRMD